MHRGKTRPELRYDEKMTGQAVVAMREQVVLLAKA